MKPMNRLTRLTLLTSAFLLLTCAAAMPNTVATLAGPQRVVTGSSVSSSGTVAPGAVRVEFLLSSDFTGTIAGVTFTGSADSYKAFEDRTGGTLPAIAYTITGGSIRLFVTK